MSTIPHEFHSHSLRSTPKNPLSHERILKVCYAYRTLHNAFIAADGKITSELYTTMLEIDREIISWEQRSAKLHYAARKQSEARAAKRASEEALPRNYLDELPKGRCGAKLDGAKLDNAYEDFTFGPSAAGPATDASIIPDATKASLAKYKAERTGLPPDNAGYKKSGLV
jgi:hypothetical protein